MPEKIKVYVEAASPPAPAYAVVDGRLPAAATAPEVAAAQESAPAQASTETALAVAPRPRMLEVLPKKYMETRPPLMYRLVTESDAAKTYARIARSRVYRANAFSCGFFYKPISRCLIEWED